MPDCGLLCDLLWATPDTNITGWSENVQGVSFTFGTDVVARFVEKHGLDLVCRSRHVAEHGYEFFSQRKLVTIFSVHGYMAEFRNPGAIMHVGEQLHCSFQVSGVRFGSMLSITSTNVEP